MSKFPNWLPPPDKFLGFIAGITASVFWGFHPVVIRFLTAESVSPAAISALRLLIGSSTITLVYLFARAFRRKGTEKPFLYNKFFWLGVAGLSLNFFFFHLGLQYTIASNAILLEAFAPVVVLLLVILFLPQRLGGMARNPSMLKKVLLLVLAGSIGSSLLIVNQPKHALLQPELKLTGDLIEFGAMFFFALYLLSAHEYQQRSSSQSPLKVTAHYLFFCGLLMIPFIPWKELAGYTTLQWFWIFILGIFSTNISYVLWQTATKFLDVVPLALLFSLSSIFNVAIESLIFQLDLSFTLILGALLILGASVATQWFVSKNKLSSPVEIFPEA